MWSKLSLVVFHFLCGAVFANNVVNYGDVVHSFIEKVYVSKELSKAEQQEQLFDLSEVFWSKDESKFNAISGWKLLQTGAAIAQGRNDTSLEKCLNNTMDTIDALARAEMWAVAMIDSTGRLESGLLRGNVDWLGLFSECVNTKATRTLSDNSTEHLFDGQYCTATLQIGNTSSDPMKNRAIQIGLCVPSTCTQENVNALVSNAIASLYTGSLNIDAKISQYTPKSVPLTKSAICVIVLLSLLGFIVLIGTLYDICLNEDKSRKVPDENEVSRANVTNEPNGVAGASEHTPLLGETQKRNDVLVLERPKSTPARILLAFSVYTNASKILTTQRTPGALDCIHGIRFISMSWVILGHSCMYMIQYGKNHLDGIDWFGRWTFQAVGNATVSVDTFFVLGGVLVSYLLLKELNSKDGPRHINWPMFFIHRFWRLIPMYMLALATYSTLAVYWGNGPLWPYETGPEPNCKKYWWTNLLFVNNFLSQYDECLGWTWYLAVDMQFFIISPLVIISFYYRSGIGIVISGVLILASFLYTALYSAFNHIAIPITLYQLKEGLVGLDRYFDDVYQKPWCRIGPYIIGIITGYFLHITEKQPPKLHKAVVALGWITAAAMNLAVLYGTVEYSRGVSYTTGISAFYNACSRTAWGIGVSWVIFACCRGFGGFVNTILSWPALIPLSRLTYAAYLVHLMVLTYYCKNQEDRMMITELTLIWLFLGTLVTAYMVAFIVSLAFEVPTMALEKILFRRN